MTPHCPMPMRSLALFGLSLAVPALPAQTVDYARQIAPLWDAYCVDCHSADDADGGFALDSFAALMQGGEEGAAIVAGKAEESLLVKFLEGRSGRGGKNEFMPPGKRDKLKPEEVALIKTWINTGAKGPAAAAATPVPKAVITPKIAPTVPLKRPIQAVAFSPKLQFIAVGRYGEVELVNPVTRAVVRRLGGFTGKVNAVAFSPDGESVYAAGGEAGIVGVVKSWKTRDGAPLRSFEGHADAAYALAVTPDGTRLATGAYDQKIRLWDTATGREVALLKGHNGAVNGLAFRPDGKVLASASADRTVKLWNVQDGRRLDTLSQPTKEQTCAVFGADGRTLFAAGSDNRIRAWAISADAREGSNRILTSRFAHEGGILTLALSADGSLLASAASDRTVKIWNTADLTERLLLEKQPDWSASLAFTDQARLIAGRIDGTLTLYESATGKAVAAPAPAKTVAKPAKVELTNLAPRAAHIGGELLVSLAGKGFTEDLQALASHPGLKLQLAKASVTATRARLKITASADVPRGVYEVWLKSAGGESARLKIHADDLKPVVTTVADFRQAPVRLATLPASVWGTLTETGQHDAYRFTAQAGEELVFDLAVAQVGSAAKAPTLEIVDARGAVLAVNRGLDSGSDPFLAWTAPAAGEYAAIVSNTTMDGSASHVYRLTLGALPYVTGWSPLTAQAGKATEVTLIGHHLGDRAAVTMTPTAEGAVNVPLDTRALRFRSQPALRVSALPQVSEIEDGEEMGRAQTVAAPVTVNGRLARAAEADHFAFAAKKGQTWVLETLAAQAGSPADTKLEVLHSDGRPVARLLLQAVRDSYNNFRSVDANNPDIRLQNWEEMDLNEYVWFNGDIMKIFRMPRGPDGGSFFYTTNGLRRAYFDTSATAHSLDEPCYVVRPHPLGAALVPNGLPVFTLNHQNDDSGDRKIGRDSRLFFTPPADGRYVVRVTDTRGWGHARAVYALSIRPPQPDFSLRLAGANPTVMPGAAVGFSFRADRRDGFEAPIAIDITGLPPGYSVSTPLVIEAGHDLVSGSLHAAADARADADWSKLKITATAPSQTAGRSARAPLETITHDAGTFGKVSLGAAPKFSIVFEPDAGGQSAKPGAVGAKPLEITLAPGQSVKAWLRAERRGNDGLINLDLHGLPHGVIVEDIGLNGVQIREKESERPIFLRAAAWVAEQDKLCHAALSSARNEHDSAGLQTSPPVLLKIRKAAVAGR